jgi:hypothetical protein
MPVKGLSVQRQGANMSFVSVPGLKGKVYVPDESREGSKKYPCKDCFSCQQCSDDRCRVCLSLGQCSCGKLIREKAGKKQT